MPVRCCLRSLRCDSTAAAVGLTVAATVSPTVDEDTGQCVDVQSRKLSKIRFHVIDLAFDATDIRFAQGRGPWARARHPVGGSCSSSTLA